MDLSGIEKALTGIHLGLAMLTKNDVWALGDGEAENAARAIENVAKHYPSLAGHDKLIDWIMLLQVIASMYGTRIYLSMPEKKKAPERNVSNVATFPGAM